MKPVSRSIGKSLRQQNPGGRQPEKVEVVEHAKGVRKPSMIASGEGGVESPPGGTDSASERSAAVFGHVVARRQVGDRA